MMGQPVPCLKVAMTLSLALAQELSFGFRVANILAWLPPLPVLLHALCLRVPLPPRACLTIQDLQSRQITTAEGKTSSTQE